MVQIRPEKMAFNSMLICSDLHW